MMNHPVPYVKALHPAPVSGEPMMGSILQEQGKLSADDVERVLALQSERQLRFGEAALALSLVRPADIEQALARQFDFPCLQPGDGAYPRELVAAFHASGREVEALRTLRTQLMLNWFGNGSGNRELVIAAVNAGDGNSLLIANLAVAFAQLGERTLIIDANLRRPRQHAIFNCQARAGLADILAQRAGMESIVKAQGFSSLSILTAGTFVPNPHDLVNRPSMNALRESLHSHFDIILVDVPPLALAADGFSLALRAGGLVLVARRDRAMMRDITSIGDAMRHAGVKIVGAVMNDF